METFEKEKKNITTPALAKVANLGLLENFENMIFGTSTELFFNL